MTTMTMTLRTTTRRVTPPAPTGPLRLTRRGRLVRAAALAVVLTLVFLLVSALGQSVVSASIGESQGRALRPLVVEPGQTLWQIATQVAPDDDPRDTVIRLEQINGLSGPGIRAGQQLLVPVSG